tara:strand:+ start:1993 stop:2205 length:213 start_codon:yes stop_codon:yes gene_type:complete
MDKKDKLETVIKSIHDINTFACSDNELYLSGKDQYGQDITLIFNAIEILEWLDIDYIKKQSIKYINKLNK